MAAQKKAKSKPKPKPKGKLRGGAKGPGGRPALYCDELAEELCRRLASGNSLSRVCEAKDMPGMTTFFSWVGKYPEFLKKYELAADERHERMAEETLEIADDARNDYMESNGKDCEGYRQNGEAMQRSRLRVDTRKWYLSKMKPKKYGDKLTQEHTGADGGAIKTETTTFNFIPVGSKKDKEDE